MTRIFSTLAVLSNLSLLAALLLGWFVGDPATREAAGAVGRHMLTGMGAILFATLVHAIVLTYFMGTGRWLEETTLAYKLPSTWFDQNRRLKHRTLPPMVFSLLMLIVAGGFGAAADPATGLQFQGFGELNAGTLHMLIALAAVGLNIIINLLEYAALQQNGGLVLAVLGEVRRIRAERGLDQQPVPVTEGR